MKISKKRVDYSFRINGIPKFFLEAKSLKEDLDGFRVVNGKKVTYVEQAINYAWHKGCTWAVLTDFESVKKPQEIKGVTRLLKNIMRVGGSDVVILTARSAYKPVKDYLKDVGIDNIYVVALADADPQKKADWIEDKIKSGVNDVFFIDDSHKNIAAVKALAKKYPKISLKVRHVQHETPTTPPQDKIKGGKKEKDFIKGNSGRSFLHFRQYFLDFLIGAEHPIQAPCGAILCLGRVLSFFCRQDKLQKNNPVLLFLMSLLDFTVSFKQLAQSLI
jgi:hypothetical protein